MLGSTIHIVPRIEASRNTKSHTKTLFLAPLMVRSLSISHSQLTADRILENIDKSHDVIEKVSIEATESATQALLQRFRHSKQNSAEQLDAHAKLDEILYLAPSEEGIEYARRDGSQSSKTTLGVQMRRFEKIVAREEKELESLWKQWASVEEELAKIAEDALGPDWATILPVFSANDRQMVDDSNDEAFEKNIKRLKDLISATSEQAMEKMVASEKVGWESWF